MFSPQWLGSVHTSCVAVRLSWRSGLALLLRGRKRGRYAGGELSRCLITARLHSDNLTRWVGDVGTPKGG